MKWSQAFRVFFRILRDAPFAGRVAEAEKSEPAPAPRVVAPEPEHVPVRRSDALTLLAALQREGRLVDFLQEPIDNYPDAQVGSAVREVHRSCRSVLERYFNLAPVVTGEEGATMRVEKGYDPGRIRLTGNITEAAPHTGTLVHPGWEATRCEIPEWTGSERSARVVAAAEVEIRP